MALGAKKKVFPCLFLVCTNLSFSPKFVLTFDGFLEAVLIHLRSSLTCYHKLAGTDPEEVIRNAFQCFDEDNSGKISEERLRELLTTMGDRYSHDQVLFHLIFKRKTANFRQMTCSATRQSRTACSTTSNSRACSSTEPRTRMNSKCYPVSS